MTACGGGSVKQVRFTQRSYWPHKLHTKPAKFKMTANAIKDQIAKSN